MIKSVSGLLVLALLGLSSLLWVAATPASAISAKVARELMPFACAAGQSRFQERGTAQRWHCLPCPKYTAGLDEDFILQNVFFVKARGKQTLAVMDFEGCESHADNWGGSVILRWKNLTNWEFLRYDEGRRSYDCLKFPGNDGVDRSVCSTGFTAQGFVSQNLAVEDFSDKNLSQWLVSTTSNDGQCMNLEFQDFLWDSVRATDLNRDARPDLLVEISQRTFKAPATWKCGDDIPWAKGTRVSYRLEFLFDGRHFTATAATAKTVKYLKSF